MARYIPRQGDFLVASFDPQSGNEQEGRRPALVVSKTLFNQRTGLAMLCPITNTDRTHPLHVSVPANSSLTGFVMVEQIKSIDYASHRAKFVAKAPQALLDEVLAKLDACIYSAE